MKQATLYIGHNVNGTHYWESSQIEQAIGQYLGIEAYTTYQARGMWRGEAEDTTVCIISALDDAEAERIREAVPVLAAHLEQECIAYEVRDLETCFIAPISYPAEKTA